MGEGDNKKGIPEEIEVISYLRFKRPPTLKQYLIRKKVQELMKEKKGGGFVSTPEGRPIPKLASELGKQMTSLKADEVAKQHPEWVEEYKKKYSGGGRR